MLLKAHVEEVLVENDRAVGVRLSDGSVVRANTVVSNASSWDTMKLLPASAVPDEYRKTTVDMPINRSFMHLHLGFDAAGLLLFDPRPSGPSEEAGHHYMPFAVLPL